MGGGILGRLGIAGAAVVAGRNFAHHPLPPLPGGFVVRRYRPLSPGGLLSVCAGSHIRSLLCGVTCASWERVFEVRTLFRFTAYPSGYRPNLAVYILQENSTSSLLGSWGTLCGMLVGLARRRLRFTAPGHEYKLPNYFGGFHAPRSQESNYPATS